MVMMKMKKNKLASIGTCRGGGVLLRLGEKKDPRGESSPVPVRAVF